MSTQEVKKRKNDPRILAIQSALYKRIKILAKEKKIGINAAAYMVGASQNLGHRFTKNKDVTLYVFLKLVYMLGYELAISRSDNEMFDWSKDKIMVQRYMKLKNRNLNAKRKARGLPEGDDTRIVRIRNKRNPTKPGQIIIVSRKAIGEIHAKQNDIFGTP